MRNYGDITKISGYEVPPVDVVIGGSPCQDLSVAGLRKGLAGQRSGLFMDQIRIVKEMRENDRMHGRTGVDVRPRFMVWENVCGAFSSNGGKDFLAVLEETAHIADENAVIPEPPQGKWRNAGVVMGDGWSIAWRVHDAQFWGVPQRRRRISLVADFAGGRAPEICFVRKSLSGHPEPCGKERKETPGQAVPCAAYTVRERAGCEGGGKGALVQSEKTGTLGCSNDQTLFDFRGGNPTCNQGGMIVYDSRGNGDVTTVPTMTGDHQNRVTDYTAIVLHESAGEYAENASIALRNSDYKHPPIIWWDGKDTVQTITANLANQRMPDKGSLNAFVDFRNGKESGINGTLQAKESGGSSVNYNNTVRENECVRRLTPLECERLQGFPSELKLDVSKMTKDEYIAYNILEGNIIVDAEAGKVFRTRGPGGVKLAKPQEMNGSDCNGYLVVKISNGTTKMTCRIHRIIWISQRGVIPDGYCIDHVNSNKKDNRISNLQLLTPQENSTKASIDGLYATGEDNGATKLSPDLWDEIAYLHHCEGKTMRQLAEVYGISKSRIQQIVKEVGWTDIGDWTDDKGKKHKTTDSNRYKALGNSIALPFWKYLLKRISAEYERDATMASLFSGIGGFDLLWTQINGMGSVLWEAEIDDFPSAVCRRHFGSEETGEKGDFYEAILGRNKKQDV